MRHLLFISSFFISFIGFSQEVDSTEHKRFVSPSLYIDYGKLLTIPSQMETKYEGGIELLFLEKFPLMVEIGLSTLSPKGAYSNGTYESTGTYYRVGAGYSNNFTPKNRIGLSFRYASSNFGESGRISIESTSGAQDSFIQTIDRTNLTAQWWEVVFYSDQRIIKNSDLLRVGLNLRLRILQDYDKQEDVDIYSIPGYGRSFDKTIPAANFFIKVNF